jgi:predicted RecA/RadA family phage recombinase
MLLNGAAVLAFLFWICVTLWRQVAPDPGHIAFGNKVRALAIGGLHGPLLVAVPILGLVIVGAVAPSYLISVALIGVSATIGLRRLTIVIRGTALGRLYRPPGRRVAGATDEIPDPIVRAKPRQIRVPKPIDSECNNDQQAAEPVELHISFAISRNADQNEAALLAIRAVTAMKQTRATQAPTCLQRQTADGGAILDIRFRVCDVRRGQEHVLDEVESRLWDLLHESRIPFAIRPRHPGPTIALGRVAPRCSPQRRRCRAWSPPQFGALSSPASHPTEVDFIGSLAMTDALPGVEVEISVRGVYELPKATGALNEGAAVSWDNSAHNICAPGSGKFPIGVAVRAEGSSRRHLQGEARSQGEGEIARGNRRGCFAIEEPYLCVYKTANASSIYCYVLLSRIRVLYDDKNMPFGFSGNGCNKLGVPPRRTRIFCAFLSPRRNSDCCWLSYANP